MITKPEGKCQFEGCEEEATEIACGRRYGPTGGPFHPDPARYCEKHASIIIDEGSPEFETACPNCECRFGVN